MWRFSGSSTQSGRSGSGEVVSFLSFSLECVRYIDSFVFRLIPPFIIRSESMWNSHVSSLLPIYNRAYEGVARAAITNLSQQTITSWGPAGASFPRDVISVHTTDGDRQKITKQSSQDSALVDFVRTIGLQHRFAQQYADNIQELAFLEMKRATDLSFATDSDHFNKAYTAIFARLAISSECCESSLSLGC